MILIYYVSNPIICCSTVTVKDTNNSDERVIYDAKEVITRLQAPVVKDAEVMHNMCVCVRNVLMCSNDHDVE